MNLAGLSIADVFAIKAEAKAKQSYYQGLQYATELSASEVKEVQNKADIWGARVAESDIEIMKRINSL